MSLPSQLTAWKKANFETTESETSGHQPPPVALGPKSSVACHSISLGYVFDFGILVIPSEKLPCNLGRACAVRSYFASKSFFVGKDKAVFIATGIARLCVEVRSDCPKRAPCSDSVKQNFFSVVVMGLKRIDWAQCRDFHDFLRIHPTQFQR